MEVQFKLLYHFGIMFSSWEHFGGAVDFFFVCEKSLEHQKCPKRRQPRNKVANVNTFLELFFSISSIDLTDTSESTNKSPAIENSLKIESLSILYTAA